MPPNTGEGPLEAPSDTAMSPPPLSATEVVIPNESLQEPPQGCDEDFTSRAPSPSTPETSTDRAPVEPWNQRIMKDGLVKGVAFDWFQDLTQRVATIEEKVKDNEDRDTAGKNLAKDAQTMKMLPEVRDCNWEHFKNRYSLEEGIPAIETLLAGHDLDREMEEEQLNRLESEKRRDFIFDGNKQPAKLRQAGKKTDTQLIERVRINSPEVLSLLAGVTGQMSWEGDKPHTFLRPFKIFIHFHDQMEEELEKLASNFPDTQAVSEMDLKEDPSGAGPEGNRPTAAPRPETKESNTARQAYLEIKCYVEFVRNRLVPIYHKFDQSAGGIRTKVRFAELWSLFRYGELIFERKDSKVNQASSSTGRERVITSQPSGGRLWRVYDVWNENISWVVDSLDVVGGTLRRNREDDDIDRDFTLMAYRIDYDGNEYAAAPHSFAISPFDGEKDITKLPVYPARFQRDSDNIINLLQTRGKRFQKLMGYQHRAIEHDGWTLLHDPAGLRLSDPDSKTKGVSEYIASDVIIDFEEAYQRHPMWKPVMSQYGSGPWSPVVKHDLFPVIQWSSTSRSHEISRVTEVVVEEDDVSELEWYKFAETDNFVVDTESFLEAGGVTRKSEGEDTKQEFTDEDLALLPARLFVYSLRDRRFVNADIRSLKLPPDIPDPFGELKIPDKDKALIRSMVLDHFEKKQIHRQLHIRGKESYQQDFIPGKGKGLVILLHGAPGVGKTATAEAVAYTHNKPLFPITCGDLGIDPHTVERTLSDIFRLANLWDCVLLLDEAEVFLSRREKMDDSLQRNALVSIFLRTLEYYPGILFLTTNRVGVLDDALNSRLHISLFFKHLDLSQTQALFEMNIRRCRLIAEQRALVTKEPVLIIKEEEICYFAMQQYEDHVRYSPSTPWWNGRQIRNAFQIATSLAYERATDEPQGSQKYLGKVHFEQILSAINDYTNYRLGVHRKNDEEMAHERAERMARPAKGPPDRHPPRRYEGQQEMTRSRSPYRFPHQQFQPSAYSSTMITPDRPREAEYYSPHSDVMTYGPSTPSRPRAESSFGSPLQGDNMPAHRFSADSPDTRVYGTMQYYRSQE